MDVILANSQKQLHGAIPAVRSYDQKFYSLNQWWGKINLVGKINSQKVAPSILEQMQDTQQKFSELQTHLVFHLVKEHLQKRIAEDQNKSQVAIDILIRNLFERTADVGFLATDADIRSFLSLSSKQDIDKSTMYRRLEEYRQKYSVYDDIIILDCDGRIRVRLDQQDDMLQSFDSLIEQTLKSKHDYVETFRHSDLQRKKKQTLIYSCAIKASDSPQAETLGVLCLCFRFQDEMEGIFVNLLPENSSSKLMILDENGEVIASSHPRHFPLGKVFKKVKSPEMITIKNQTFLSMIRPTTGYEGFFGLGWSGQVLTPLNEAFKHHEKSNAIELSAADLQEFPLFSAELKHIHKSAVLVKEDLSLVVLNGIITSARQNAVEFMPVLQEIKKIGEDIASIFSDSLGNLQSIVVSSRLSDVKFNAALAADIMDRNLYERANDCRWWALTTAFRRILAKDMISAQEQQVLHDILRQINELYTVYTNLYLYDKNGRIVAVSNIEHKHLIGDTVESNSAAQKTLQIKHSQQYSVSEFVKSKQYADRRTYIYNAAITDLEQQSILGGIGVVFDSEPQLLAMLQGCLPTQIQDQALSGCFALYCQRDGLIISATAQAPMKVGEIFDIENSLLQFENGQQHSQLMQYRGKRYSVGIAVSKGYREYKTTGDYKNDIVSLVFVPS